MTTHIETATIPGRTCTSPIPASTARYLDLIIEEGKKFAVAAGACDLDAPVAACPEWTVRELVTHLGLVHLWAAANVAYPSDRWIGVDGFEDLQGYWPGLTTAAPDDDHLVPWYRATLANLVDVLRSAPEGHRCLTFLPAPSPVVMWARRQAFEIAVHRFDAEAALGTSSAYEPSMAVDMLDELLTGFAPLMRREGLEEERVIRLAPDGLAPYWVTLGDGRIRVARDGGQADVEVAGSAADVCLLLWNRPPGPTVRITGEREVLDTWASSVKIHWV